MLKLSIREYYQNGLCCKIPGIDTGRPESELESQYGKKGQLTGPVINTGTARLSIDAGSSIIDNGTFSKRDPTYIYILFHGISLFKTGAIKTRTPRNGGKKNGRKMAVGEPTCDF